MNSLETFKKLKITNKIKNHKFFLLKLVIIYSTFYLVGLFIIDKYIALTGDSLFWTCSTIIQGLGALLALIGMFIIYQFQIINILIIETHKKSEDYADERSSYKPDSDEYKYWDKLIDASNDNLKSYSDKKNLLKKTFIKPVMLIGFSLILSFIALPFGDFSFISTDMSSDMFPFISISSYLFPLIVISIWSIISLIFVIIETVKGEIKWSYFRPII